MSANTAAKKLMQARIALQNKQLKKSGNNKFAGYSYFELGDFLPTVQQIFADLGLCGLVSFGIELATLTITDTDNGSEVLITSPMSSAALKGCHEVQNLGAVQTYLRRYLWVTAMEIVEHDALDKLVGSDSLDIEKPKVSAKRMEELTAMLTNCKTLEELGSAFVSLKPEEKKACTQTKDALKVKLSKGQPNGTSSAKTD